MPKIKCHLCDSEGAEAWPLDTSKDQYRAGCPVCKEYVFDGPLIYRLTTDEKLHLAFVARKTIMETGQPVYINQNDLQDLLDKIPPPGGRIEKIDRILFLIADEPTSSSTFVPKQIIHPALILAEDQADVDEALLSAAKHKEYLEFRSRFLVRLTLPGEEHLRDLEAAGISYGTVGVRTEPDKGDPMNPIKLQDGKVVVNQEATPEPPLEKAKDSRAVFVVHGRNEAIRKATFEFLRALGLHPLEWAEARQLTGEPNPYVGTILKMAFENAQAVLVVMTPDDEARLIDAFHGKKEPPHEIELTGQPRQNVLFEAGMAMGRDDRRTVLIQVGELRPFSDIYGRHIIEFDGSTEKRQELADRLGDAKCAVNTKGTDWHTAGDFTLEQDIMNHLFDDD